MRRHRANRGSDDQNQILVSFELIETADEVVSRLFESLRRTGLELAAVEGDDRRAYPLEDRVAVFTASSWTVTLRCPRGVTDLERQLEVFVGRAELFIEPDGGIRVGTLRGIPLPAEAV